METDGVLQNIRLELLGDNFMYSRGIGLIERWRIAGRGRRDAEKNRLSACKIEEYFRLAQIPVEKDDPNLNIECYISSFISHEFTLFVDKRERLFRYKNCLLETPVEIQVSKSSNKVQRLRFSDALARLDKKIADLNFELSVYRRKCEEECNKIELSMKRQTALIVSLDGNYDMTHVAQVCEKVTSEFQEKMNATYETIMQLLNEKVRLLEDMRSGLEVLFARHLARISYYIDAANTKDPKLSLNPFAGGILKEYSPLFVLGRYRTVLEETQKQREKMGTDMMRQEETEEEDA